VENYGAPLDEVPRTKPTASKGRYLKKVTVSTTSPRIPVDPSVTANSQSLVSPYAPVPTQPAIWQYLRAHLMGIDQRAFDG
jgi:hypothetical protein